MKRSSEKNKHKQLKIVDLENSKLEQGEGSYFKICEISE